ARTGSARSPPPSGAAPSARLRAARRDFEQLARLDRQRGGSCRGDERLAAFTDSRRENSPPLRIELRENVIEKKEWRRAGPVDDQLRLREQQPQDGQPLIALRAERRQIASVRDDADLVQVGAGTGPASLEVARVPRLERLHRRRIDVVYERRSGEPELAGPLRKRRREQGKRLASRLDERSAELDDLLGPRRQCVRGGHPELDPTKSRVPLRKRGAVLSRQRGPSRREPPERPVEVRASYGRPALHNRQPVRREDKRRHRRAQLLRRAQRHTVHLRALGLTRLEDDLQLERAPAALTAERNPARSLTEADQLRVVPRPR